MSAAVTRYRRIDPEVLSKQGKEHLARAAAAWPARRPISATLPEFSGRLGPGRPERVGNLTGGVRREPAKYQKLRQEIAGIESGILPKTKNKV